jgi:hypothetical protein
MNIRTIVFDRKPKDFIDLNILKRIKRGFFPVGDQYH